MTLEDVPVETPSARRLRLLELGLVLLVAFGDSVLTSLAAWWDDTPPVYDESAVDHLYRILHATVSLGVLAYVLFRQERRLRDLGLTAERRDITATIALTILGFLPTIALSKSFYGHLYTGALAHPLASFAGGMRLGPLLIAALLASAALEELIVRAYLMTEVATLTGRMELAVLASTVLQTTYHLYQGMPAALLSGCVFLIASIYYASTRRITPVILSHFLYNLLIFGAPG
jgi:membrane protease YdiL (CAAX protease family)